MNNIFVVAGKNEAPEFITAKKEIISYLRKKKCLTNYPSKADLILVLGGDGTMLKAIRQMGVSDIPFCGLNFGHIGFLMNEYVIGILKQILNNKLIYLTLPLLQAKLYDHNNQPCSNAYAFNDIVMERTTPNTAKIKIQIGSEVYFDPLSCDGVLVSTTAGSTGYNASAGGVIMPIETKSLILTAICPAIFHKWKSSPLAPDSKVIISATELDKRPVRLVADGVEISDMVKAEISYSNRKVCLAYVASQDFRRKVLDLQFRR